MYRVDHDGRAEIVYVAGPPADRWAFWNGEIFRRRRPAPAVAPDRDARSQSLTAPMPATVHQGAGHSRATRVKKGDTLIVLEAMKMELPLRAAGDAVVTAVHCREGELVQAGRRARRAGV